MRPPDLILTPYEQPEHELQIACTKMLYGILLPTISWTAIDHGHSMDKRPSRAKPNRYGRVPTIGELEAWKRKARGVKPGICDYQFLHAGNFYTIELKTPEGVLSEDQKDWIRGVLRNGGKAKVCWSQPLVLATVIEWGLTRKMQVAA